MIYLCSKAIGKWMKDVEHMHCEPEKLLYYTEQSLLKTHIESF